MFKIFYMVHNQGQTSVIDALISKKPTTTVYILMWEFENQGDLLDPCGLEVNTKGFHIRETGSRLVESKNFQENVPFYSSLIFAARMLKENWEITLVGIGMMNFFGKANRNVKSVSLQKF